MSIANLESMRIEEASFVVLDFETVTPKGRPPEPIELGAMRINPGFQVDPQFKISWLIRPPNDAPITWFDTKQTGIRWEDVADKPPAAKVLREFDTLLRDREYVMVAQNAKYEAAIISLFSNECSHVSGLPFVDTIALAKYMLPELTNYKLDTLANQLSVPIPADRHRALPDVEMTVRVFLRLLALGREGSRITRVVHLTRMAGITMQTDEPRQMSLFD